MDAAARTSLDKIPILITQRNRTYLPHNLHLPQFDTDAIILDRLRDLLPRNQISSSRFYPQLVGRGFVMQKVVMGRVQVLGLPDVETQATPAEHVHSFKKDDLLSKLLHDSSVPLPSNGRLKDYLINGTRYRQNGVDRVWCLYYKLDGVVASMWALVSLVVSFIVGIAASFGSENGELGLGVGAGLMAVFTLVQSAIIMRNW
ncbi:hypothetical protein BDV96DRAFT_596632 [Lophiotrema nucula]|uniref:Uncharacterized protein n=1 Tax=Lophiotrema nucula TaxID=690887 RepID=A0A6A5ZIC0_9PLEO|nr:hypothetical protein BDV96DRAFT_596632 [Lophiotrema nucula]